MARTPGTDDFADKLRSALARLNISRSQLAQAVGVDKSVATRWAAGDTRPSEHNLIALTRLLQGVAPDFVVTDWQLAPGPFAARLGLTPAVAVPSDDPFTALLAAQPAEVRASAAHRYAGLWAFVYGSVRGLPQLFVMAGEVRPEGREGLRIALVDEHIWAGEGPLVATEDLLYAPLAETRRRDSMVFLTLFGTPIGRAVLLDGIICTRPGRGAPLAIAAGRIVGFRIGDPVPDPHLAGRRLAALVTRIGELNRHGWDDQLTPWVRGLFSTPTSGTPQRRLLRLPVEDAVSMSDLDLGMYHGPSAERRHALAALRAPLLRSLTLAA